MLTIRLGVPSSGILDVRVTAWKDNFASAARLLQPAIGRFVFARRHLPIGGSRA